jgi:hypothetical protein
MMNFMLGRTAFTSLRSSKPSFSGIRISEMTKEKFPLQKYSKPSFPFSAVTHEYPSLFNL